MSYYRSETWLRQGYLYIYIKDHPFLKDGDLQFHRLVVQDKLGRKLVKGEVVHHIDHDPMNNNEDNLQVMGHGQHISLHQKGRKRTPEQLAKMSENARLQAASGHHPMLGKKHSVESRERMGRAKRGKPLAESARNKLLGHTWNRGKVHTDQSRANMSAGQKGKVPGINKRRLAIDARRAAAKVDAR